MRVVINGADIYTERDIHMILEKTLDFGPYYGRNLDALWDALTDVERPVELIWEHASVTSSRLDEVFGKVVKILERIQSQDVEFGYADKFVFELKD